MNKLMTPKFTNRLKWAICTLSLLFALSCKKDNKQLAALSQDQQKATEAWYSKVSVANITYMKASDGSVVGLQQYPHWAKAKVLKDIDGSEIIAVPVTMNLSHNIPNRGSFLLLVEKENEKLKYRLLFSDSQEKFSDNNLTLDSVRNWSANAFSKRETAGSVNLNKSIKPINTNNSGSKPGALSNLRLPDDCIDWYLVTTEYVDGVAVSTDERYLYSSCPDGGGGGSHGVVSCSYELQDVQSQPYNEMLDISAKSINGTTRQQDYHWMVLKAKYGLWYFVSHEVGTHKYVNGEWVWDSLSHGTISLNGGVAGFTLECTTNSVAVNMAKYNASISLNFNYNAHLLCKELTIAKASDISALRLININDGPQVLPY